MESREGSLETERAGMSFYISADSFKTLAVVLSQNLGSPRAAFSLPLPALQSSRSRSRRENR
jgi:hypothetical protein